jgi:hypothetical protein
LTATQRAYDYYALLCLAMQGVVSATPTELR